MMSGHTPPKAPGAGDPSQSEHVASAATGAEAAAPQVRVDELEAQIADLTDRLLRSHAELDNIRKRSEREKADTAKYAVTKLATDMVSVVDNLQRALAAVPPEQQTGPGAALFDGVKLTEQSLVSTLERYGVRRIEALGQIFDPNLHEAVFQEDNPSVPSGTVLQVFQEGFVIEGRTLRAAMVKISRGGPKAARSGEAAGNAAPASDTATSGTGPNSGR